MLSIRCKSSPVVSPTGEMPIKFMPLETWRLSYRQFLRGGDHTEMFPFVRQGTRMSKVACLGLWPTSLPAPANHCLADRKAWVCIHSNSNNKPQKLPLWSLPHTQEWALFTQPGWQKRDTVSLLSAPEEHTKASTAQVPEKCHFFWKEAFLTVPAPSMSSWGSASTRTTLSRSPLGTWICQILTLWEVWGEQQWSVSI